MTTIIGIQGDGYTVLVADTRITSTDMDGTPVQVNTLRTDISKLATNGKYTVGTAGDLRAINLLTHTWEPPATPPNLKGKKLDEYVTNRIIPTIKTLFEKHGYTHNTEQNHGKAGHDSELLLTINNTLYQIDGDYAWFTDNTGHYAIGTGAPYALGALNVLPEPENPGQAKQNALKAIQTAAKYDPNTAAPYHTHVTSTPAEKTGKK